MGRAREAHFQIDETDQQISRKHFLLELLPPRCRLIDLGSRNGVTVNGVKVAEAELKHGDQVRAGRTVFELSICIDGEAKFANPLRPHNVSQSGESPALTTVPDAQGYEVGLELGRGSMGVVHKAWNAGRPVAIKFIRPEAQVEAEQIDRFLREARILGTLDHPNIVRMVEVGRSPESLYIAMEYVDGVNAAQLLMERGPLRTGEAVDLVCQVLAGLSHAHAKGFVHRDIKPSNILVGKRESAHFVKIADFGLARSYESHSLSGLSFNGEMGGTPAFMAPEQVTHFRDSKPMADQYAAGMTLYNLLTNTFAFNFKKGMMDRLTQILTDSFVPIQDRRKDLPTGLTAAIHKAISREPKNRFRDVDAFRSALTPFAG